MKNSIIYHLDFKWQISMNDNSRILSYSFHIDYETPYNFNQQILFLIVFATYSNRIVQVPFFL